MANSSGTSEPAFLRTPPICRYLFILSTPDFTGDNERRVFIDDVTCLGCGCACDDIRITVQGGRIVEATRACELGATWFGDGSLPAEAAVDGRRVTLEAALASAGELVRAAKRPLVYLAPGITNEAAREAVALADIIGAAIDSVTSDTAIGAILAAQERGRASATLGEGRHRADVVVWWGVDPALRYPRYTERYLPASRTTIAVDVGERTAPPDADRRFLLPAEDEVATLTALRALVGVPLVDAMPPDRDPVTSAIWARARVLASALTVARYVVVVADAEPPAGASAQPVDHVRMSALIAFVQALNGPTRAALSLLRGGGNRSGADAVLTSQTGYPAAVDFARGVPRYRPFDGRALQLASRGEVDAAVVVGYLDAAPDGLSAFVRTVPAVVIGPDASAMTLGQRCVAIDTGLAGVHDAGTVLRLDDVPLPARAVVPGPPATAGIVKAVRQAVVTGRQT
jgi:formylmethanofuran dehydrogenase subunit B